MTKPSKLRAAADQAQADAEAAAARAISTADYPMPPIRGEGGPRIIDDEWRAARDEAWALLPELHGNRPVWNAFTSTRTAEALRRDARAMRAAFDHRRRMML